MSRMYVTVLAAVAAVALGWAAIQVLGDDDVPEVPAPVVVDAPSGTGTTPPSTDEPTLVPPPTVGPGDDDSSGDEDDATNTTDDDVDDTSGDDD